MSEVVKLNNLKSSAGTKKKTKRLGRGQGSGLGKTCGRGQKGQKSRTGVSLLGFEGGQTPIFRRLPKRGFSNVAFANRFEIVNLSDIVKSVEAGKLDIKKEIGVAEFVAAGLVRKASSKVKLLAKSEGFNIKFKTSVNKCSENAKQIIEKLGGQVSIVA